MNDSKDHKDAAEPPLDCRVRPRAWAAFTPEGNIRVWTSAPDDVLRLAEQVGMALTPLYDLTEAPVAIMDTRDVLGICAPTEDDFPALYALQGHRVALVDMGPNKEFREAARTPCSAPDLTRNDDD